MVRQALYFYLKAAPPPVCGQHRRITVSFCNAPLSNGTEKLYFHLVMHQMVAAFNPVFKKNNQFFSLLLHKTPFFNILNILCKQKFEENIGLM
jgi:hypothetical protein